MQVPNRGFTMAVTLERKEIFSIIQSLPKVNAHCHLSGEVPIKTLKKFATPEQKQLLKKTIAEISAGQDYKNAFVIFGLINQIINTHEKLQEAAYQAALRFREDNNQFVLMRTGLKILEGKTYQDYLNSVLEGIKRASKDNFNILLMLSLKRASSLEMAKLTVDLALRYRERGVVGIDISDISTDGDIRNILPELRRAKQSGLKIAVHMGELAEEKDQMIIIDALEPDLVDHGVKLCPQAEKWVRNQRVPVTVCLTSSLATKMHKSEETHPWVVNYIDSQHPILLGTDDSTVFGNITLSDEFMKLSAYIEVEEIVNIAKHNFECFKTLFSHA